MANPITSWADLAKSLSDTYRKWLETRNSAYERKRDKKQVRAINTAEEIHSEMNTYWNYMSEYCAFTEDQNKDLRKIKVRILKLITKFNKLD